MWEVRAEYEDGTVLNEYFDYNERGIWSLENERQYELECYAIEYHEGCVWYSVNYVEVV